MILDEVMAELKGLESERNREGMGRFRINVEKALGISVADLRRIGRRIKKDHELAGQLWETGVHEARILASIVEDPAAVTEEQMDRWVAEFDSWDLCDQCCGNLFNKVEMGWRKAVDWSEREREFEKRAGFALMAYLTHLKKEPDERYLVFLPIIAREAGDGRNYVKKAVNWALREIGKRNATLREAAIETARGILAEAESEGKRSARRWVANDALRELTAEGRKTLSEE